MILTFHLSNGLCQIANKFSSFEFSVFYLVINFIICVFFRWTKRGYATLCCSSSQLSCQAKSYGKRNRFNAQLVQPKTVPHLKVVWFWSQLIHEFNISARTCAYACRCELCMSLNRSRILYDRQRNNRGNNAAAAAAVARFLLLPCITATN